MKKLVFLLLFAITLSIGITPAFAQIQLAFVEGKNINATIITDRTANLNWQFTNFNATLCKQDSIRWNEGTGPKSNFSIETNSTGSAGLQIFGWHIFDIVIIATCPGPTGNTTTSGPFDVIVKNPNKINGTSEPSTIQVVNPTIQSISNITNESYGQMISTLAKMNSELLSTINKLIDLL